jgi:uncharacterized protein (TIGR01777 family)
MRFLIAGSSGFLGTRLREELGRQGHHVTPLVRRPPGEHPPRGSSRYEEHEVRWDPYDNPLGHEVVDDHDVVVNLAGSPTAGNPHSGKWARELERSRVTTTQVLAEAIAASETKPRFLAGNGISYYGDHGDSPVTEDTDSRGGALLTKVTRAWQIAADRASDAGARVIFLRTSPVYDRRSEPLRAQRLLFKAGLGGPLGTGRQYVPMISARDWVDAVIHLATADVEGPVILSCEEAPTNAEFTRELAQQLHRPAFFRVPGFVLQPAAGEMANEVLGSIRAVPAALLASGFTFSDPDVASVLREGLSPSR